MAEKIVGIEVQIGGDTTGLDSALSKTNKQINSTQKELSQVEKLLKLDPSNTELVAQKQELLSKAVKDTSVKVEALKQAKANADKQMQNGTNINQEQYRKLQREIASAEQSLDKLETESKKTAKGIKEVGDNSSNASKSLSSFGSVASSVGKGIATVGATALSLATSLGAVEQSTREYRTDISKLETNTEQAGLSFDKMKSNLSGLVSLTDESDSAIEALSNLMKTGFDDTGIEQTLDSLSGAIIAFPDTLKIESLADGLQETLATGSATGAFGELLERCGMNLDEFNKGLSKAGNSAQKQEYILETLAKTGMASVNESYREANKNLLTIKEAQFQFNDAMATLGKVIEPVTAQVMSFGAEMVNSLTSAYENGGFEALIAEFGKVLNQILNKIVEFLPKLISMGMEIINNLITGIQENLSQIVSSALETLNIFITTILDMLPQIMELGITLIVELLNGIASQLPTLIPTIVQCVILIVQTLLNNISMIVQARNQYFNCINSTE